MSIEISLKRLKEFIFGVDNVSEQKRLICSVIEEYKKESEGTQRLAKDYAALQKEHAQLKDAHLKLQQSQIVKPPELVSHDGVMWKRTVNGFEKFPRCEQCADHPAMTGNPPGRQLVWVCHNGHMASGDVKPPP